MFSDKTTKVMAVFTAVATTAAFAGCGDEDKKAAVEDEYANRESETLTDDNGREYKLYKNDDGTETARYDDGSYVTFKRNEDGLSFLSGTSGLLAGLAAGYFLHRGLSGGRGGYYDSSRQRYVTSQPVRPIQKEKEQKSDYRTGSGSSSSGSKNSGAKAADPAGKDNSKQANKAAAKPASSGTSKPKVSSSSPAKSGFGSAGARSSAS